MMVTVSLDSPSCEVTLFDPVSVVYRDATWQAKGLYYLKYVGALWSGLTYLSRYNSGWFCHKTDISLLSRLISDWCRFEWVQVDNPCRVKSIRIAASSVMDNPTLLLLLLVSVTLDFHLPLEWLPARGQLRCEERESSHRLGGLEGVHWPGV
jgi:hypothetical protein